MLGTRPLVLESERPTNTDGCVSSALHALGLVGGVGVRSAGLRPELESSMCQLVSKRDPALPTLVGKLTWVTVRLAPVIERDGAIVWLTGLAAGVPRDSFGRAVTTCGRPQDPRPHPCRGRSRQVRMHALPEERTRYLVSVARPGFEEGSVRLAKARRIQASGESLSPSPCAVPHNAHLLHAPHSRIDRPSCSPSNGAAADRGNFVGVIVGLLPVVCQSPSREPSWVSHPGPSDRALRSLGRRPIRTFPDQCEPSPSARARPG